MWGVSPGPRAQPALGKRAPLLLPEYYHVIIIMLLSLGFMFLKGKNCPSWHLLPTETWTGSTHSGLAPSR